MAPVYDPDVDPPLSEAVTGGKDYSVRVGPMVNIARVLGELGANPAVVFEQAGLSMALYSDPDRRVTYRRSGQLFEACVAATGCCHFGLLVGEHSQPSHLGIAGFLTRAASTVGEALSALVNYLDLHDRGGVPRLQSGPDYCRLSFQVYQQDLQGIEQIYDFVAAVMHSTMRSLCGRNWKASRISLPRRKPADVHPYARYFGTPIQFDADLCAMEFPSHWLEREPPAADAFLYRYLEHEAEAQQRMTYSNIRDELRGVLRDGLLTGRHCARQVAQVFGMSERSFQRRLESEGTSFRQELDQVRSTLSRQLLTSTNLPVCDIAQSLGYADSSAFIRAFGRWCGCSPMAWRKQTRRLDTPQ